MGTVENIQRFGSTEVFRKGWNTLRK